ncbi:MAG: cytochrome b/b6 domain-containing protein, partial [Alphaproteobacteria bacterium]|nr:cytochrome b/b6 domain-containing protein [Alphaproteobacteria bacterium]
GLTIFSLMIIRLITRLFTSRPAPTAHQQEGAGKLRTPIHYLLYILVFLMIGSGWYTGFLVSSVWEHPGTPLPETLSTLPSRLLHAWTALILFLVIVLHVAAAVKERMSGDKDIMSRMWFGKRKG